MIARKVLAHVETWRPYRSFYAGILALAGAVITHGAMPSLPRALLVFVVPTLGWLAGVYGSDYLDRDLDKLRKPYKPIPSGRISEKEVFACMSACMYAGLLGSAYLGLANVALSGGCVAVSVFDAAIAKGRGFAGTIMRGVPAAFTVLFGAAAIGAFPFAGGWPIEGLCALMAVVFFHDVTASLVRASRNVERDRTMTARTAVAVLVIWEPLAATLPLWLPMRAHDYYALYVPSLVVALVGLAMACRASEDRRMASRAYECFFLERMLLAGAFIAGGAGIATALLITLPLMAVTYWARRKQLERRESGTTAADTSMASTIDIGGFIEAAIARLASDPRIVPIVRRWDRKCEIVITDREFRMCFETRDGMIVRLEPEAFDASPATRVRLRTTAGIIERIFTGHISLLRAYGQDAVRLDGSALDILRLSRLFHLVRAPAPGPAATLVRVVPNDVPRKRARANPLAASGERPVQRRILVADTTLRAGEQMPGVTFTLEQKVALVEALERVGVPLLEVGYPAVSEMDREAIRRIVAARTRASIQVISRLVPVEIDRAAQCGCDSMALFIGTSNVHLETELRISRDELCRTIDGGVRRARRHHVRVVFAPEDATRTDRDFLLKVCRIALDAGAEVIAIPDTVGIMTPWAMRDLIGDLTSELPAQLAVQCHDDFGLATANSLAAVEAGASTVMCSLGGIGERAGGAPLEEVACALEMQLGYSTALALDEMKPAANVLRSFLPFAMAPNKAIIGSNAFRHEIGLHTGGIIRDPSTYEPFDPALVGSRRRFMFGKHSGRAAIAHVLADANHPLSEAELAHVIRAAKRLGDQGKAISEFEVLEMARRRAARASA
ncbi:UbiA family prenyltransferase [Pendulispora brunnea]|uniref:UbiA family prenyltransferase n=1 Tax=Pendulispora brunnea TaxID=2905690 RepID=A0ABZ2K3K6_9BACT